MIPVFFPFTYLPVPALHALNACFGKIALYQPSRRETPSSLRLAEAEGQLSLRYPEEGIEEELLRRLRALREWGAQHRGERDFERLRPEEIPYTSQAPGFQIRDELRRKPSENAPRKEQDAALISSLLFLAIAQEHDQTKASLSRDMARIQKMETALFRDTLLAGESAMNAPQTEEIPVPDPPLLNKRTTAWAALFQHHAKTSPEENDTPFLFITSHPECLAPVLESAERVLTLSGIPENPPGEESAPFRTRILELLRNFEEDPTLPPAELPHPSPDEREPFALTLYRVTPHPGLSGPLSFPFSFGNKIAFMGLLGKEEKHESIGCLTPHIN